MLRFIAADLRRQWIGVVAIFLIMAFATALGVAVTLQERALRLGSARAAEAFDLIVGAPGSETQLVLSSVFLQAAPLPLMPGSVLAGLLADPRVAWAAPVGFGDFIGDFPIVGTTQPLVDGLGGLAEGRSFRALGDAVIGAQVKMEVGERFHPMHGQIHDPSEVHNWVTYTVAGRLKATGTSWDRAVIVPIEAVWRIHDHEAHEEAGDAHSAPAGHEAGHEHEDAVDFDAAIDPAALTDPDAPGLPSILVKPRTIADAYKLRQSYRTEHTLAVFPGEVLTRLYGTLGDARSVLSAVALGAQGLVGAAVLLIVMAHITQRRRQIGALRAFGASRAVIFVIVWLEMLSITGAGLIAGFGIGWLAARCMSAAFTASNGMTLPVEFAAQDVLRLATLFIASGIVATVPALLAYRQSPVDALRA
jgi:putative ABC transport system permease protein